MRTRIYELALKHPILSKEQERELLRAYADSRAAHGSDDHRTIAIRNRIVTANLRLAAQHANRYKRLPFEDLLSEGVKGLMVAVEKFEIERDLRFNTYASWWIRSKMQRACRDHGSDVRVPVWRQDGRRPGTFEIEGVTLVGAGQSLDAPLSEDGANLHGLIADDQRDPLECIHDERIAEDIRRLVLSELDPREREVIEARFLRGSDETLAEVGARIGTLQSHRVGQRNGSTDGITRERVRQIEAEALSKLRAAIMRRRRPSEVEP